MATIANLDVNLRAQTAKFDKNVKKSQTVVERFANRSAAAISGLIKMAAPLAAGFGLVNSIQNFTTAGDRIQKLSIRTGIGARALTELSFAAEQSGTDIEQLGQAMFRANRRIGNAVSGTGPAVRALDELGISAERIARLGAEDQFNELVRALNNVENSARQSQLGFEIFGDNWRQLQPLITSGTENINMLRKQAVDLGITFGDDVANKAAEAADAFNRMSRSLEALSIQIGATFGPKIVALIDLFTDAIRELGDEIERTQKLQFEAASFTVGGVDLSRLVAKEVAAVQVDRSAQDFGERRIKNDSLRPFFKQAFSALGGFFDLQGSIDAQKNLIDALRQNTTTLQPLPQVFERGTSAQIGFINNLKRQEQQNEVRARERRKIEVAEQQLKVLEDLRKEQQIANDVLTEDGPAIL